MSQPGWRLFLKSQKDRVVAVAFSSSSNSKTFDFREDLSAGRIFWAEADEARNLWPLLESQLPENPWLHVVATAEEKFDRIPMGSKFALVIRAEALTLEYARVDRFFEEFGAHAEEFKKLRDAFLRQQFSDREIVRRLRRALSNKSATHFLNDLYSDLPQLPRLRMQAEKKARLLLHICCGPDAGGVIRQLKNEFDLTCFWYDPNIQPRDEYELRLNAFEKVAKLESVPAIIGEYDVERFFERIRGLEHTPEQGAKCSHCYDMRLERTALEARDGDFEVYATTLAISPHKVQRKLQAFGDLNEKRFGVPYYHRNFMKEDGFKDSVEYSRDHDIYRQDYCGCLYSLHEGGLEAQEKARALGVFPKSLG
jgi:epoxyqueuosine reductase